MAFEMVHPVFIRRTALRFSHIMEKHRPAQNLVRRNITHTHKGMFSHAAAVMGIVLRRLHQPVKFRQDHFCDPCFPRRLQIFRTVGNQQFCQFHRNPFRADMLQRRRKFPDCLFRLPVDAETQLRAEPDRPQDPQRIFPEPFLRNTHTADCFTLQIPHSSVQIHQPGLIVVRHRIDRKIPALQIFLQISGKFHTFRMAGIFIFSVDPVRCHFMGMTACKYCHGSMLQSRIHRPLKYFLYLIGRRRRGDIPVVRNPPENAVTDTSAHRIGFIALCLEAVNDHFYTCRKLYLQICLTPFLFSLITSQKPRSSLRGF